MKLLISKGYVENEDEAVGINRMDSQTKDDSGKIKEYVPVPLNDLVMEIIEGILKLKHAQAPTSKIITGELRSSTQKGNLVSISTTYELLNQVSHINEVKKLIRPSQVQLFMYILFCWRRERCNEFQLNIREYFDFRGIRRRKENVDRFYEDLIVLSALSVDILAKNKKQEYRITGRLLQFNKDKEIHIFMDNWINEVSPTTYTLLNKYFFRYSASQYHVIMISLKLSQLMKVKSSRKNQLFRIKTITLMNFLGIQNEQIKKQGYRYFQRLIEDSFYCLQKEEDFKVSFYEQSRCYDEFMQSMIDYSHQWLYEYYQSLVYK